MSKRSNRKKRHLTGQEAERAREPQIPPMLRKALKHFPNAHLAKSASAGPAARKSSELLIAFAEPLTNDSDSIQARRNIYKFALLAWNLSIYTKEERDEVYEDSFETSSRSLMEQLEMRETLEFMVDRKLRYFAEYTRAMADVTVTVRDKEMQVQVASVMSEEEHSGKIGPANKT